MKLKSAVIVMKGAYIRSPIADEVTDVRTVYQEVGGIRQITVPEKKLVHKGRELVPVLVTLRLPKGGQVSRLPAKTDGSTKARANKAYVVSIVDKKGNSYTEAFAKHNNSFKYPVGKTVTAKGFRANDPDTCSAGIHFYRTPFNAWQWVGA